MSQTKREHTLFALFGSLAFLSISIHAGIRCLRHSLRMALLSGDTITAQKLLNCRISVDDASFQLALSRAVAREDVKTTQLVLTNRPHLAIQQTLFEAAGTRSVEIVRILLDHGADANGRDQTGNSVLGNCLSAINRTKDWRTSPLPDSSRISAVTSSSQQIEELLRHRGAHLDLYEAVRFGDVREVEAQLKQGFDPNSNPHGVITIMGYAYNTFNNHKDPSSHSQANRYQEIITLLHAHGAHCTPMEAILYGAGDELRWHLAHGANPNACLSNGTPLLLFASQTGNAEAVTILLDHGAKIDATNAYGRTALMLARDFGHKDAVQVLIARGAASSPNRWTRSDAAGVCRTNTP